MEGVVRLDVKLIILSRMDENKRVRVYVNGLKVARLYTLQD